MTVYDLLYYALNDNILVCIRDVGEDRYDEVFTGPIREALLSDFKWCEVRSYDLDFHDSIFYISIDLSDE